MNGPGTLAGQVILGRYRIVRQLGRGGMGAVFEAIQLSMNRPVAMKLIHSTLAEDPELVARFHREMQVTSAIEHNNTVRVLDFGETESGQLFLVMELLDGRSLSAVLRQEGPLPLPRVVHIGGQVLRALAAAHHAGVVHRDLKPENVMILDRFDERDAVKVLDFGIARVLQPGADAPAMTMEGTLLGTPGYMSPEQGLGRPVGPPSDLYSFGVLLYQMATGALPYAGTTLQELLVKQATEEPRPPSVVAPGLVAAPLEALILELLVKDPAARPTTAQAQARLTACVTSGTAPGLEPLPPMGSGGGTVVLPGAGAATGATGSAGATGAGTGTAYLPPPTAGAGPTTGAIGPGGHVGTGTAYLPPPSSAAGPATGATGGRPTPTPTAAYGATGPQPGGATAPQPEPSAANPVPDHTAPRPRSHWPITLGVVLALLAAGGAATFAWVRHRRAAQVAADRDRVDALLAKDDYPAAPEACRARAPADLALVLDAATRLADVERSGASPAALEAAASLDRASAAGGAELPEVWMLLARARLRAKSDAKGAFEAAGTAAKLCPTWASAHELRAASALAAHDLDEVLPAYQRAVDAAPDWAAARKGLGLFLLRSRSYREAAGALSLALAQRPDDLGARLGRAQARLLSDDLEGARADAEEATRRSPDRAEGWLLLGHVLAKAQKLEEALSAFCHAKKLGSAEAAKYCTSE
jgi:tetratricopeptide (TPR) repeat protein